MRRRLEHRKYRYEALMRELNEFMVCVKVHLPNIPVEEELLSGLQERYRAPGVEEVDALHGKLLEVLRADWEPWRC